MLVTSGTKGITQERRRRSDAALAESNKEAGCERFRSLEVSDKLAAVLRFALGENEYKSYADITDVYNRLKDIKEDLDSMRDDCFHMSEWMNDTLGKVKKLVPEEDQ